MVAFDWKLSIHSDRENENTDNDQNETGDIMAARAIAAEIELSRGSWSSRDSYLAFFNNIVRRDYLRGVYDKGLLVSAVLAGIRHTRAA